MADYMGIPTAAEIEAMTDMEKVVSAGQALREMGNILLETMAEFVAKPNMVDGIEVTRMMAEYIKCYELHSILSKATISKEMNREF